MTSCLSVRILVITPFNFSFTSEKFLFSNLTMKSIFLFATNFSALILATSCYFWYVFLKSSFICQIGSFCFVLNRFLWSKRINIYFCFFESSHILYHLQPILKDFQRPSLEVHSIFLPRDGYTNNIVINGFSIYAMTMYLKYDHFQLIS